MRCKACVGVSDGDKLHVAHLRAEIAGDVEAADRQVGHAFDQQLFNPRQHLFAQAHAAAAALTA